MENGPPSSTLSHQAPEVPPKCTPRPVPTLAGAFELSDVRALLREWVTTISGKPMVYASQFLGFNICSSSFWLIIRLMLFTHLNRVAKMKDKTDNTGGLTL